MLVKLRSRTRGSPIKYTMAMTRSADAASTKSNPIPANRPNHEQPKKADNTRQTIPKNDSGAVFQIPGGKDQYEPQEKKEDSREHKPEWVFRRLNACLPYYTGHGEKDT